MINLNSNKTTSKTKNATSNVNPNKPQVHIAKRRAYGRGVWTSLATAAAMLLAVAAVASAADGPTRLSGVVNVNTANSEQLQLLPGVGEKRAAAILSVRTNKGGFKTIEELMEVKGVGTSLLERLKPHLTVSGKTTAKHL